MDYFNVSGLEICTEMSDIDHKTESSFGDKWTQFDQKSLSEQEHNYMFDKYFHIFSWEDLPEGATGFDMGFGSGHWAALVAPRVRKLTCIDPSHEALTVARSKLSAMQNTMLISAGVTDQSLAKDSQYFGYSSDVSHHLPDTVATLRDYLKIPKSGAPSLAYLYYRFDNWPLNYAWVLRALDLLSRGKPRLPARIKLMVTNVIAEVIYLPLTHLAFLAEKMGFNAGQWLLSSYKNTSFYTVRTDFRDSFSIPLEQLFAKNEITTLMHDAGVENIRFSNSSPFRCAVGQKQQASQ